MDDGLALKKQKGDADGEKNGELVGADGSSV